MSTRMMHLLEAHPILGWCASLLSLLSSWATWTINHADDAGKVFGAFAGIFGMAAGYFTMRIQHRNWRRAQIMTPALPAAPRKRWYRRR